ncbi:MAG: chromate transporter [Bryobacteraceae bacterium]
MLRSLLWLSFRVVHLTFGGGDPTMAVFHQELVVRRKWLTAEGYGLIFGLARVTPGTNLLAFCIGTAWRLEGWRGALGVGLATSFPCSAAVVSFAAMYQVLNRHEWAMAAIGGTLAAAVGLMVGGSFQLVRKYLPGGRAVRTAALTLGALALSLFFDWSPIWILLAAAGAGWLWRGPEGR